MFFLIIKNNVFFKNIFISKQKEEQKFSKKHKPFISLMLPADEQRNRDSYFF